MKTLSRSAALFSLAALAISAHAKIITVTTENNVSPPANQTSLLQAINLLADGDTIQFSIPGSGVHYINTPPGGYPLITANRITIDGYSQPGAVPNSNPIHAPNNAQLKIVLSSTNGNAMSMGASIAAYTGFTYSNLGFGSDELAILGFFRATNVVVKGLAIVSDVSGTDGVNSGDMKTISFCPDSAEQGGANCGNWQVSGCWFGLNPATGQLAYMPDNSTVATPTICIAAYRTRDNSGANARFAQPGTIGVAAGSANPRAEFNVFITGYGFDSEGLNYRISGNFWDVLPDGMHNVDVSIVNNHILKGDAYIEIGRSYDNITIGTDGDGVNDSEEGNVFGGYANGGDVIDLYGSSSGTNFVIAGNYFSVAIDGTTRFDNSGLMVNTFDSTAAVRFGSDFDGVSDAWEANRVYNFTNASDLFFEGDCRVMLPPCASLNPGIRLSFRGNVTVNNELVPYSYAKSDGTCLICFTNYEALYMDTNSDVIPNLNTNSAYPRLKGTFAPGIAPYTNIFIDVYQLDQEGWTNGMALSYFDTFNNGFAQGSKYFASFTVSNTGAFDIDLTGKTTTLGPLTVTVNYSADPPGTHNGRVHTSNFSSPVTLALGGAESVGLTHLVPDVLLWYHTNNYATSGPVIVGAQVPYNNNWEPYISVLGDSTFLIQENTYADDGTATQKRFAWALQPAAGGPARLGNMFYDDNGVPFTNANQPFPAGFRPWPGCRRQTLRRPKLYRWRRVFARPTGYFLFFQLRWPV